MKILQPIGGFNWFCILILWVWSFYGPVLLLAIIFTGLGVYYKITWKDSPSATDY